MRNEDSKKPEFGFPLPPGYDWALARGLLNFGTSPLYPWYLLDRTDCFSVNEKWPRNSEHAGSLIAFARRRDNDDIACFMPVDRTVKIVLIHGWTVAGYDVVATYDSFWDWLKSIIDDFAEFADDQARQNK